jgi:Amt family ammonium transporter
MLGIFIWVFIASSIVWLALKVIMGIRVTEEDKGVDTSECGMEAYTEFTT